MKQLLITKIFFIITLNLLLLSSCTIVDTNSPANNSRLKEIIDSEEIPDLSTETDNLSKTILTNFQVTTGTTLVARYATVGGTGNQDGTSWKNAWAGADLRNNINAISDANDTKVYVLLVAGGMYTPTTGNDREVSFTMKDYIAIVGGFDESGNWERNSTTLFSGDLGTENDYSDNSQHVFFHDQITLDNALLYGVTVTSGNADGSSDPNNQGGGMYNNVSSPRIIDTIFSNNRSSLDGGGMYNNASNLRIIDTLFCGNRASKSGGGMYNESLPSSHIINTAFSNNVATYGGGMYNEVSSLNIIDTVFSDNSAVKGGGGYNNDSSIEIIDVIFNDNSASDLGGGMYNERLSSSYIINTVFSGNSAVNGGGMYSDDSSLYITNAVFRDNNSSRGYGGGMYNGNLSTPQIMGTVFSDNRATYGGGMYNIASASQIFSVVFRDNNASQFGGGIYNDNSSSRIMRVVFRGNIANEGGGMANAHSFSQIVGSTFTGNTAVRGGGLYESSSTNNIINAVFFGNAAKESTGAPGGGIYYEGSSELSLYNSIFLDNATPNGTHRSVDIGLQAEVARNIQIVGSVIGIGEITPFNGIKKDDETAPSINYTSLSNAHPGTKSSATMNDITYLTLSGGSGAKDLGLYVKLSGDDTSGYTYYMSDDGNDWYTAVDGSGNFSGTATLTADLPAGAEDLTATDINGKVRTGRPDAGVTEE